jgi:hypothetical protein
MFIWCLWSARPIILGNTASETDRATAAVPAAEAPTTIPIKPINAPSTR